MSSEASSGVVVNNFMGGLSYRLNPLQTLEIVATSMICGEAQYYRKGTACQTQRAQHSTDNFRPHYVFQEFYTDDSATDTRDYYTRIVEEALDYDFGGCVELVGKIRTEYYMRLNSNYLLVKAVHHPKRAEYNKANPKLFLAAIQTVGAIPTDWTTQYKLLKESGKPIPTIWKRAIAEKLQGMTAYHANKYLHGSKTTGKLEKAKNDGREGGGRRASPYSAQYIPELLHHANEPPSDGADSGAADNLANLVDLIRITHPKPSPVLTQLIRDGKVDVEDSEQTWEKLRSSKKTWTEIIAQIRLPHTALLRNLCNIIEEFCVREDSDEAVEELNGLIEQLVSGVANGKQFPFRYYSAYKMVQTVLHQGTAPEQHDGRVFRKNRWDLTATQRATLQKLASSALAGLDRCVLASIDAIPPLNGRVDSLSDNSGSSRGAFVSEYGTTVINQIANLSAILSAYRATKGGSVWVFGDTLEEYVVVKDKSILEQLDEVNALGDTIGGGTETGIWLFWKKHIEERIWLDTVFIYSDMQAGTGGLFSSGKHFRELKSYNAVLPGVGMFIDVLSLVKYYRDTVNPITNLFSVQVAGYDNSVLPDILYRGAILSGWTGKEIKLAYEMTNVWDHIESTAVPLSSEKEEEIEYATNGPNA